MRYLLIIALFLFSPNGHGVSMEDTCLKTSSKIHTFHGIIKHKSIPKMVSFNSTTAAQDMMDITVIVLDQPVCIELYGTYHNLKLKSSPRLSQQLKKQATSGKQVKLKGRLVETMNGYSVQGVVLDIVGVFNIQ